VVLAAVAGTVLALDLITKRWATETLSGRPPVPVLGEIVQFTYTRNTGIAFGLGAGVPFPYWLFSVAAAAVIVYLFVRQRVPRPSRQVALALILGGALGNLVDRVTTGEVVDFILVGYRGWHWPVFNVADSAVSVGVVWFALVWPRHSEAAHDAAPPAPSDAPEPTPGVSSDDAGPGSLRAVAERGGAAGPLPRRSPDRPFA
jgi:signal peptidase II